MKDRKKTARMIANTEDLARLHNGGIKTACTSACLTYFGIDQDQYRYSQFLSDMLSILRRKGFNCRSRKSSIKPGSTIGSVRGQLKKLGYGIYLVNVSGHVLLMDQNGKTIIDTDPRKRDRRRIIKIYKIYKS